MDIINLIVLALRLLNWLAGKVDQAKWEASGKQKLVLELTAEFEGRMNKVRQIIRDNENLTPEERKKILMED